MLRQWSAESCWPMLVWIWREGVWKLRLTWASVLSVHNRVFILNTEANVSWSGVGGLPPSLTDNGKQSVSGWLSAGYPVLSDMWVTVDSNINSGDITHCHPVSTQTPLGCFSCCDTHFHHFRLHHTRSAATQWHTLAKRVYFMTQYTFDYARLQKLILLYII